MLILPLHEVRPGAKLAMSVMHPKHREQELLKSGFVLDEEIITRLRSLEVTQVLVDFPGLADLDQFMGAAVSPERASVLASVKDAITINEKSTRPVVKYTAYLNATRSFVRSIMSSPKNAVFIDILHKADNEVEHATSVAHLSIVLGLKLDAYLIRERPRLTPAQAKDVSNLGVAGMMHDIGKTKLAPELRKYNSANLPAAEADLLAWQQHTQFGYDIVHGRVDSTIAAAVLHHHQRWDGTGFPFLDRGDQGKLKFSGGQIHPFARILAAADLFERLATTPQPGASGRRPNYQVLSQIKNQHAGAFDPEVLAVMPQFIPPFSPGRRVGLSDGTEAVVTGFFPFTPYQPTVKRLNLSTMTVIDETIDLRNNELTILSLDGASLDFLAAPTA